MHHLCYFRIDNIEVEPQPVSDREIELRELIARVPTMRHAELDDLLHRMSNIRIVGRRRDVLSYRRAQMISLLERRIEMCRAGIINRIRRERFIGPLTIQMRNGHPF